MSANATGPAPEYPRAVAGWAEAIALVSRPLTDVDALSVLDNALRKISAAFSDDSATESRSDDPNQMHPLFIAEAAVRISRSRRVTSSRQRIDELHLAQASLEAVPEIHRSEHASLLLSVCLTERAVAQPTTRQASLPEAKKYAEFIQAKNPNSAHALRQLGFIALRSADSVSWKEADLKLNEAQRLLDQASSLDQGDYLSICLSGDVLLQLAERRSRQESQELARLAKERYASASKLDTSWPNAFLGLGWTELLLARRSSGVEAQVAADAVMVHAREVLKLRPDSSRAFRLMGNSRRASGRVASREAAESLFEESFRHYEEGNKCRPDDYALLTDWAFAYLAQAARREGAAARQSLAAAEEKAKAALEQEPNYPHAHVAHSEVFWRAARLETPQRARELLAQARETCESALRIAPDLEWGLVLSARVATAILEREPKETRATGLPEAEQFLRRALENRPDNEFALESLGDIQWLMALDRTDYGAALESARNSYDEALKADSQLEHSQVRVAEIDVALAKMHKDQKLMAGAIERFRSAVRQFPDRARVHVGLGKAIQQAVSSQLSIGDASLLLNEGIAAFRQAATLDPRNLETYRQWRSTAATLAEQQPDRKEEHLKEVAQLDETIARLTTAAVV